MIIKKSALRTIIKECVKQSLVLEKKPQSPEVPMPDKLETVGEMLQFVKAIRSNKKAIMAAKGGLKIASDAVPLLSSFKTFAGLVKNMYKLEDEFSTNSALDNLNVDDKISKIVDDKVENAFLNDWIKKLEKLASSNPDAPLEKITATQQLSNFLKKTFDKRTVDGF